MGGTSGRWLVRVCDSTVGSKVAVEGTGKGVEEVVSTGW